MKQLLALSILLCASVFYAGDERDNQPQRIIGPNVGRILALRNQAAIRPLPANVQQAVVQYNIAHHNAQPIAMPLESKRARRSL